MSTSHFFARLVPHRAGFPADISAEEQATMSAHAAYLRGQLAAGTLVVAGPVMDPAGVYGMAVFEVADRDVLDALLAQDPAMAIGRYEVAMMASAIRRPPA